MSATTYRGMNAQTGQSIADIDHLRQSITDILTTPRGARVMRREYGSDLPRLIDGPINARLLLRVYTATAYALARWEQRLKLTRVYSDLATDQPGGLVLTIEGTVNGSPVRIAGITVSGGF
jgi:phage baseplate assembly protein W